MDAQFQILEKLVYSRDDKRRLVSKHGDKVLLPERILHGLVDLQKAVEVDKLPHPLVFRLSTPSKSTYVGVREFHAEDDTSVFLTQDVAERLGIDGDGGDGGDGDVQLSLELALNVSGFDALTAASIEVRPMERYDDVRDWKTFLESTLSGLYTAVTTGDVLHIDVDSREYVIRVERVKTSNAVRTVCVVDRDIDLSVVGESVDGDAVEVGVRDLTGEKRGFVPAGHVVKVLVGDGESVVGNGAFAVGDEFVGSERFDCATMGDMDVGVGARCLYAFEDVEFRIVGKDSDGGGGGGNGGVDTVQCGHCKQFVSVGSHRMHENFCARNNVLCEHCGKVFFKDVPETHWQCCGLCGDGEFSLQLHVKYMHECPTVCACGARMESLYACCVHAARECPCGLHECRFCHLAVPRGDATSESMYYGLSGHEVACGAKTVECGTCSRRVKVRDVGLHEEMHRRDRASDVPCGCSNVLCPQLRCGAVNELGLCGECFGPLYSNVNDPDGRKLRGRLERKYILMMRNGCGDALCDNELCCTGESMTDIVRKVKGLDMSKLQLCVDEKRRGKMRVVRMFDGSGWSKGWIVRALEECGWEVDKVLPWLDCNIKVK